MAQFDLNALGDLQEDLSNRVTRKDQFDPEGYQGQSTRDLGVDFANLINDTYMPSDPRTGSRDMIGGAQRAKDLGLDERLKYAQAGINLEKSGYDLNKAQYEDKMLPVREEAEMANLDSLIMSRESLAEQRKLNAYESEFQLGQAIQLQKDRAEYERIDAELMDQGLSWEDRNKTLLMKHTRLHKAYHGHEQTFNQLRYYEKSQTLRLDVEKANSENEAAIQKAEHDKVKYHYETERRKQEGNIDKIMANIKLGAKQENLRTPADIINRFRELHPDLYNNNVGYINAILTDDIEAINAGRESDLAYFMQKAEAENNMAEERAIAEIGAQRVNIKTQKEKADKEYRDLAKAKSLDEATERQSEARIASSLTGGDQAAQSRLLDIMRDDSLPQATRDAFTSDLKSIVLARNELQTIKSGYAALIQAEVAEIIGGADGVNIFEDGISDEEIALLSRNSPSLQSYLGPIIQKYNEAFESHKKLESVGAGIKNSADAKAAIDRVAGMTATSMSFLERRNEEYEAVQRGLEMRSTRLKDAVQVDELRFEINDIYRREKSARVEGAVSELTQLGYIDEDLLGKKGIEALDWSRIQRSNDPKVVEIITNLRNWKAELDDPEDTPGDRSTIGGPPSRGRAKLPPGNQQPPARSSDGTPTPD